MERIIILIHSMERIIIMDMVHIPPNKQLHQLLHQQLQLQLNLQQLVKVLQQTASMQRIQQLLPPLL